MTLDECKHNLLGPQTFRIVRECKGLKKAIIMHEIGVKWCIIFQFLSNTYYIWLRVINVQVLAGTPLLKCLEMLMLWMDAFVERCYIHCQMVFWSANRLAAAGCETQWVSVLECTGGVLFHWYLFDRIISSVYHWSLHCETGFVRLATCLAWECLRRWCHITIYRSVPDYLGRESSPRCP